jgi:Leucine-rich repeat (LRR) protein
MVIYCKVNNEKFEFNNIEELLKYDRYNEITYLVCTCYKLTKLPSTLQILNCSNNELTKLPELPSTLQELYCYSNKLTELPELPSTLQKLDCSKNKLTELPELLSTLQKLDCTFNNLTKLPELPSTLQELDCSNNELTELPELPQSLKYLNGEKYVHKIEPPKDRKIINKVPSEDKCMISLQLLENQEYEECINCHKPYILEYLLKWLEIDYRCPNCTKPWKWSEFIYKN